jgi:hypothetical protein
MVVLRLDSHHARPLGRPKAGGEGRAERDRHLAEDVAREALAHDSLDPVDDLHGLDPTFQHREQRPLGALVGRVLARQEADVGRRPGQPLAIRQAQSLEDFYSTDLVRRHHLGHCLRLVSMNAVAGAAVTASSLRSSRQVTPRL